jgi:hypothetical protein
MGDEADGFGVPEALDLHRVWWLCAGVVGGSGDGEVGTATSFPPWRGGAGDAARWRVLAMESSPLKW